VASRSATKTSSGGSSECRCGSWVGTRPSTSLRGWTAQSLARSCWSCRLRCRKSLQYGPREVERQIGPNQSDREGLVVERVVVSRGPSCKLIQTCLKQDNKSDSQSPDITRDIACGEYEDRNRKGCRFDSGNTLST
jgi:hypothetical protein